MNKLHFITGFIAKELWRSRIVFVQMIILASFAMTSFFTAEMIHDSLNQYIANSSQELLGADVIISSRNEWKEGQIPDLLKKFPEDIRYSVSRSFYTMAAMGSRSTLAEIFAIDDAFPLYGGISVIGAEADKRLNSTVLKDGNVISYPELLLKLDGKIGSTLNLGQKKFTITGTVDAESTTWFAEASFAPRIYLHQKSLLGSNLLGAGSISWNRLLIAFKNKPPEEMLTQLSADLEAEGFHVSTLASGENRTLAILEQMTRYLKISALIAIFILLISITYLYRDHLEQNIKTWAILSNLGLSYPSLFAMSLMKLFLTIGLAGAVGIIFAAPLSHYFTYVLLTKFGVQIPLLFGFVKAIKTIFFIFMTCLVVNIPFLLSLRSVKLKVLLDENLPLSFSKLSSFFSALFIGLSIIGFALAYSGSTRVAFVFALGFVLALLSIIMVSLLILKGLNLIAHKSSLNLKLAVLNLTRQKSLAIWTFSASILAVFLITLPEQLGAYLKNELTMGKNELPSLFLFDVQEEQTDELVRVLQKGGYAAKALAPMVRARLTHLNDEDLSQKIAEADATEREKLKKLNNRGYNLSYRSAPDKSETVVAGHLNLQIFDAASQQIPEISLEKRFAERLNISLNDVLNFDVQGVSVLGKVTSIRTVRWLSFQPNFFVLFQPGVLEEAPKTYLATVPALDSQQKNDLQALLSTKFPNISSIDVSNLMEKMGTLVGSLKIFFQVSFTLAALSGFFLVLAIISRKTQRFINDFNILKILGYAEHQILRISIWQNLLTAFTALIIGTGISITVAHFLSAEIFGQSAWPDVPSLVRFALIFLVIFFVATYILLRINIRKKVTRKLTKSIFNR